MSVWVDAALSDGLGVAGGGWSACVPVSTVDGAGCCAASSFWSASATQHSSRRHHHHLPAS